MLPFRPVENNPFGKARRSRLPRPRALVNFAARDPELKKSRLAIVYSQNELALAAATALEDQAGKLGWSSITKKVSQMDSSIRMRSSQI